jgi:hypothetical protein
MDIDLDALPERESGDVLTGPASEDVLRWADVHDWIAVEQNGAATFVDPESLRTVEVEGRTVVPMSAIWQCAAPEGRLADLALHFTSEDGFDTRDQSSMGVPALLLEHAFVDAATRDVVWTIEVPEEFAVKKLAEVFVQHTSEVTTVEIDVD